MSRTPDVELTSTELHWLAQIHFRARDLDLIRESLKPMASLADSLLTRQAIPAVRLSYFTDPACNPGGRGKSRLEGFERNGTREDEILSHPSFMKYVEYFVFGPDLPPQVIQEFKAMTSCSGYLDSEDLSDLIPRAKAYARGCGSELKNVAEEFFKLALECGASPSSSTTLRAAIQALRPPR